MRPPADYRSVHAEAARFEPRLARAMRRSMEKVRASVSINSLAMALQTKSLRAAMALLSAALVKDALSPVATIAMEATLRGGKVGAERLNAL